MDQETIDALTATIEHDEAMPCLFACQTLGSARPAPDSDMTAAHAALLRTVDNENLWVARTAVRALGKRQYKPARQRIIRLFTEHPTDESIAWCTAEALGSLGGADDVLLRAVDVALDSKNWNIRFFAIEAVRHAKSKKTVTFLIDQLASEIERTVRDVKEHGVGDRVLRSLVEQLEARTGEKFGTDVQRWKHWLRTHPADDAVRPTSH